MKRNKAFFWTSSGKLSQRLKSFHAMLHASVIVHQLGDVRISEVFFFLDNAALVITTVAVMKIC